MNPNGATPTTTGRRAASERRRTAARDAYRRSVEAGDALASAALAAQFDRSVRWAQERIAEVRDPLRATDERSPPGNERSGAPLGRSGSGHQRSTTGESRSDTDHGRSGDEHERSAVGDRRSEGDQGRGAAGRSHGAADRQVEPNAAAQRRLDTLIVATVALVAAAASYEHQHNLAVPAGEGDLAYILPISVDGMMLATSRSILRRRRAGRPVPFLSWFGFALGFLASVAANVAAAEPTLIGRLVAAWPPVALFIAYETLAADHGGLRDR